MVRTRAQLASIHKNSHPGATHHSTPAKSRILGACEYVDAAGIKGKKADIFRQFKVSKARGWEILRQGRERRGFIHDSQRVETRGRPSKVSPEDIRRMERIIEDCDVEGRSMTWETLAYESGLDISGRTVKRAMGTLDYHKCIACRKGWVNRSTAINRKAYSEVMYARYPHKSDWYHIRSSDEVHIGVGPQGALHIIRKPGQRYCTNCIQHADEPNEADKKKIHAWAAIGHHFKSPLILYDIASNNNGKMTQKDYINQILEPVVKPWIEHHNHFVLQEDRDSGHGTSKSNIVVDWKQKNGLQSYFNCASSPDLAPIENAWQPMKQHVRRYSHWDKDTTEQLAMEGWDSIKQRWIDKQMLSMPQRLKDVIDADGAMTGW